VCLFTFVCETKQRSFLPTEATGADFHIFMADFAASVLQNHSDHLKTGSGSLYRRIYAGSDAEKAAPDTVPPGGG
jgi:hypothetical protein